MTNVSVTRNDDSTVVLEGELPAEMLEKHRSAAVKHLGANVKIDGFREGRVPEKMLLERIGEHAILEEMAQRALAEHYPQLLVEHKIDAIGRPNVTVTKLAVGNPLGFKITTAVVPEVTLPDYVALAKEARAKETGGPEAVADADIDKVVSELLKEKARADGAAADAPLPEMTDELAKTFGAFENAAALRTKIREGIEHDRKRAFEERRRMAMLDAIAAKTKVVLPEVLIDAELNKMVAQFLYDIERMGLKKDDYLKAIGKTEEDMRKDFRPDAEKRAKTQIVLNEIAVKENIFPTKEAIDHEVEHLLSHHKDANRDSAIVYITTILTNQKVLEFLERGE